MSHDEQAVPSAFSQLQAENLALKQQLVKQRKINAALMTRVEAGSAAAGQPVNSYAAFEHAALLAEQVQQRTLELSQAYQALQQSINRSEDLQASERWIRTILDQVPAMIAYLSAQGHYLFTNLGYDTFYGVSPGSLQNAALQQVHGETGSRRLQPYIAQVLQGQAVSFEIDEFNAAGALRHLLKSYVPHQNEQGVVIGFFVLNRDITERKQISEALREANLHLEQRVAERTAALQALNHELAVAHQQAQHAAQAAEHAQQQAEVANQTRTKFLAAVSHDVLQPLNAARLFNGALLDMALAEPAAELARSVGRSLDDLAGLMRSLLDLSRLDAGAMPIQWQVVSMQQLMQKLDREFQVQAKAKGVRLTTHPCDVAVWTDEGLLLRVLRNLLANAIRYSSKGGRVVFGARRQGSQLQLQVYDRGIGIAPELQVSIFNEFFRAEPQREQGLGLGLAIVQRICHLLQLPLRLTSKVGQGSCFALNVPRTQQPVAEQPTPEFYAMESGDIWVIDNDDAILRAMSSLLQGWGYRVVVAPNLTALAEQVSIADAPVDALLVDYHLDHGVTGLSVVETVQQQRLQPLAFAVISADQCLELRQQVRARAGHWLAKPVRPLKLRLLLRQLLGN